MGLGVIDKALEEGLDSWDEVAEAEYDGSSSSEEDNEPATSGLSAGTSSRVDDLYEAIQAKRRRTDALYYNF